MELMVLGCCCGKGWGMGEMPAGPFHDQSDLFKSACIESLGLFSVLRCGWSVEERPKKTIEPLRFSKV